MRILLISMLFLAGTCAFAEEVETQELISDSSPQPEGSQPEESQSEAEYLLPQPLTAGLRLGFPSYVFSLSVEPIGSQTEKETNVDYSPAPGSELTLSAGYGKYALSWKRPLPQSNGNQNTYGKSTYNDFKLEYAHEQVAISAFHQKYQGFYTDLSGQNGSYVRSGFGDTGTTEIPPRSPSVSAPADIQKRADIEAQHIGLIGYYAMPILEEDTQSFLLAFRNGPKRPRHGFGLDFLTNGSYDYAKVRGEQPFIPGKRVATFGSGATLRGIRMHSVGSAAGVASSYVLENRRTYFDGIFLLGAGLQSQKSEFLEAANSKLTFVGSVHLKFGISHKGDTHTLGMHLAVDNWSAKTRNLRFNSSNLALEFGYMLSI